jgi:hypothetical protein
MYSLTRKTMVLVVLGGLMAAIGCENNRTGVVVETQREQGVLHSRLASEVTLQRPDGSTMKLGHVGNPFFAIAFVEVPADKLGSVDPRVKRLAKRFELDSVAVIQMSIPKEKGSFSDQAVAAANLSPTDLMNLSSFIDPERRAWKMFGEPDSQTVVVVDRRDILGSARTYGSLDDLGPVIRRVQHLQNDWGAQPRIVRFDR